MKPLRILTATATCLIGVGAWTPPVAAQDGGVSERFEVVESWAARRATYFPPPRAWERRDPASVGMDAALLQEAVDFAIAAESTAPRDLALGHGLSWGREPFDEAVGPLKERGDMTGLVIRGGYVVAEWGDPGRVDMTFSVTKTFLSTTVGLAVEKGLIGSVNDPVRSYMPPIVLPGGDGEPGSEAPSVGAPTPVLLFESDHNRKITWDHMLRQTSAWRGTLWGKPDWADRPSQDRSEWLSPERAEPGTEWEYNDVRVNLLALAATQVWRRPLPEVLRDQVMDPIGASNTWRWHGYENSWVTLDGRLVQAVSGGGHWGGGMYINAMGMARLGYLYLRNGQWAGRQLVPQSWIEMAETPTPARPGYGFMNFFLNTGKEAFPSAPESAFAFRGAGSNVVYVDRDNDLIVVARWIDGREIDGFIGRVLGAIETATTEDGAP